MAHKTKNPAKKRRESSGRPRDAEAGRFAYEGLDRVLHEKARLGIITSLYTHPDGLLFGDLKELCGLTDGNLSRHLQILSDAKLIEIWKGFRKKRPQTLCRLTKRGRERFLEYVGELERVLSTVEAFSSVATKARAIDARALRDEGWIPT